MGYALFANRKIFYTNMVYTLQQKLDNIMQQKQGLLNFSANIADGIVTVDEIAGDPTNLNNYAEYAASYEQWKSISDADGGCMDTGSTVMGMAYDQNNSDEYLAAIGSILNTKLSEEFSKQYNKKLEAMENQLDMQQKKIETQLTAAQNQLQAVEEAEGKAIENATPKYNGVG